LRERESTYDVSCLDLDQTIIDDWAQNVRVAEASGAGQGAETSRWLTA
jgi:hypothetical protein